MNTIVCCDTKGFSEASKSIIHEKALRGKIHFYLLDSEEVDSSSFDKVLFNDLISRKIEEIAGKFRKRGLEISVNRFSDKLSNILSAPDIIGDMLAFINSMRQAKVSEEKTLSNLFLYKGFPYWSIVEGHLFLYHLLSVLITTKIFAKILNNETASVYIQDLNKVPYRIIYQYALSKEMDVHLLSTHQNSSTLEQLKMTAFNLFYLVKTVGLLRKKTVSFPFDKKSTDESPLVLFLCFFSKQIDSILTILKMALNEKRFRCFVLLGENAKGKKELDELGIQYYIFEKYIKQCSTLKDIWKSFQGWICLSSLCRQDKINILFEGVNLSSIVFEKLPLYFTPSLLLFSKYSEKLLELMQPSLLVQVDDVNIYNRLFLRHGEKMKIKTLHLQYGTMDHFGSDWLTNNADNFAVFGEYDREILSKVGIDKSKVQVTGNSRYDNLVHIAKSTKNDAIPLSQKKTWNILFASSHFSKSSLDVGFGYLNIAEYAMQLRVLYSQIATMERVHLIVKPHPNPNDPEENHHKILSRIKPLPSNIEVVPVESDIFELLYNCDALITYHSTTGLEAMICKKPVFILNLTGRKDAFDYTRYGAAIELYKAGEISIQINSVLSNKNKLDEIKIGQERFLNEFYSGMGGKATEHVLQLINGMIWKCNDIDNDNS